MKKEFLEKVVPDLKPIGGTLKTKTHELSLDNVYKGTVDNVTVIAAEVGSGKSTIMANYAAKDSLNGNKVLFVTLDQTFKGIQEEILNVKVKKKTKKQKDLDIDVEIIPFENVKLVGINDYADIVETFHNAEGEIGKIKKVYVDAIFGLDEDDLEDLFSKFRHIKAEFVVSVQLNKSLNISSLS